MKLRIRTPACLCSLRLCFQQLLWEAESRVAEGAARASHPRIPCCCRSCCSAAPGVTETRCTTNGHLQTTASTHEGTGVIMNWFGQPKAEPVGFVRHVHRDHCKHVLWRLHKSTFMTSLPHLITRPAYPATSRFIGTPPSARCVKPKAALAIRRSPRGSRMSNLYSAHTFSWIPRALAPHFHRLAIFLK